MYTTIKTMRCYNKKKELLNYLQIFQKGILMSITSLKLLHKNMVEKFNFKYTLTHRLNQDCLENYHSQMRYKNGPNDHPSPVDCLSNLKSIVLGKNPGLAKHMHTNTIEMEKVEYATASILSVVSSISDENIHCDNDKNSTIVHEEATDRMDEEFLEDVFVDDSDIHSQNVNDTCVQEFEEFLKDLVYDDVPSECYDDFSEKIIEDENKFSCENGIVQELNIEFIEDLSSEVVIGEQLTSEFVADLNNDMNIGDTGFIEDGLGTHTQ